MRLFAGRPAGNPDSEAPLSLELPKPLVVDWMDHSFSKWTMRLKRRYSLRP